MDKRATVPGRRRYDRALVLGVVFLFCLWALVGGLAWHNAGELARREQTDIRLTREAAYRICERSERTKANVHRGYRVGTDEREFLELRLPLVDCRPNLAGQAADPMTRREMRGYVRRFVNGELRALPETPRRR